MRINYHILSSKISDRQTFREYIHGASRYTQLVNTSFIKIKNSIKTALKAILKPRINNVAFSNSKFLTRVLFLFHAKSRNEIKFDDDSTFLIRENVKSNEDNKINFTNGKVNMSAGYLIRLKMMSGSLNSYYNQTISETGRKKIV